MKRHHAWTSFLLVVATLALMWPRSLLAEPITSGKAIHHVGESATVCGTVASAKYAARANGSPTFLDLDQASPNTIFTVVIWGENRAAFGTPEITLLRKQICVTGTIKLFRGKPEIIIRNPNQLTQQ